MFRTYSLHLITKLEFSSALARRDRDERDELDPEECFTELDGRIMCWEMDAEEPVEVGRVKGLLIDLDRTADAWETLDSRSSELEGLYHHVFGPYAGVMRPAVAKLYDAGGAEMFFDPVLYVEKAEISVAHRGLGVGLMAMNALLTHFRSHATLAFCKPFPLHRKPPKDCEDGRDARYYDPNLAKVSISSGTSALRRYWAKAGFVKLGRGPYFVANLKRRAHRAIDQTLTIQPSTQRQTIDSERAGLSGTISATG